MTSEITRLYHRGLRGGEGLLNSFESLERAKKGDTLEMDVFLLADGSLVMTHQGDIGKTMEEVEAMTIEEFQKIDNPGQTAFLERLEHDRQVSEEFGLEHRGLVIPTYDEVLFQACDRDVKIYVELKAASVEGIEKLAEALVAKMSDLQAQGAFANNPDFLQKNLTFFSMSIEGVKRIVELLEKAGLNSQTILGWVSSAERAQDMDISKTQVQAAADMADGDWFEKGIKIAKEIGAKGILIYADNLVRNPDYIKQAHDLGLKVLAGGIVKNEEQVEELKRLGADVYASEVLP